MKVVFLDIDGVLCTPRSHVGQGCFAPNGIMHSLDREAVGLVNAIAYGIPHDDTSDVRFVLISTWRLAQHPVGNGGRQQIERHLRHYGWRGTFHDDWKTDSLGTEEARGEEIAGWLSRHPEVDSFVILDDGDNFKQYAASHVKPNYVDGLSWTDFKRAVSLLHPGAVLP